MYSKTSHQTDINYFRQSMYFNCSQNIEFIPPTRNSLYLHVKRALYQSGIWSRCTEDMQNLPSPRDFGWEESNDQIVKWIPTWMTQYEASRDARKFVKCGCKTSCSTNNKCKYHGADLPCTRICTCSCNNKVQYAPLPPPSPPPPPQDLLKIKL